MTARGARERLRSGTVRVLAFAVAIVAVLAVSAPAPAQPTEITLVSNADETLTNGSSSAFQAQSFTTGGHADGYAISEIGLRFRRTSSLTRHASVNLREDNSGVPGDLVATFTRPAIYTSEGLNNYTAPVGTEVSANTRYWVSVHEGLDSRLGLRLTPSYSQTGAAGWSIGNDRLFRSEETDSWSTSTINVLSMSIKGPLKGPQVSLVLSPASIAESDDPNETGNQHVSTVSATVDPAHPDAFTVTVSESVGDYTLSGTVLNFAASAMASTNSLTLTAVDNFVVAADRTVTVSGTVSDMDVIAPPDTTLTITDDDTRGVTVDTGDPAALDVPENGHASYTVVLDSRPTGNVWNTA